MKSKLGILVLIVAVVFVIIVVALIMKWREVPRGETNAESVPGAPAGVVLIGQAIFEAQCTFCHYADREETKIGPGLKGLLRNAKLPYSGKPANAANVISQIRSPVGQMPSFSSLSDRDVANILAYLRTL